MTERMPSCTPPLWTDAVPLDELDGFEGFVHVADGQVEAEVEHGVASRLLTVLQAHEVSESAPGHRVGGRGSGAA